MVTEYDDAKDLIRTSVLVPRGTHQALNDLADKGKRPLSWEIRNALEEHVKRENGKAAA
jgi:predicted transcriptional regulator